MLEQIHRRSPCGERGLKSAERNTQNRASGRSPCGERGLKLPDRVRLFDSLPSLPVRGAWVEITAARGTSRNAPRRSPCGERGLKCVGNGTKYTRITVAPRAGSVG